MTIIQYILILLAIRIGLLAVHQLRLALRISKKFEGYSAELAEKELKKWDKPFTNMLLDLKKWSYTDFFGDTPYANT
jgi:hypothetical protein